MISHEKIDEYHCETCNKKVTITKRNSIGCLPNTLIVHLQRITYDFEYDRNKKINSRLEFPREISLKQYTIEEILRKNAEKTGSVFEETEHIYFKEDEYYEYYLTGVVIHMGSADSGHYYSYINTIREGKGNVAEFDPSNKNHCDSWLEYNDSRISPFNPKDLESECFGGSYESTSNYIGGFKHEKSQSAYILTYERKLKTPVKVLLENQGEKTVIEFEEEQKDSIMKKYNWLRRMDQEERKEIEESITNSVFFDIKRKEYYDLVPFYNLKTLIPKEYYEEIKVDNQSLKKHMSVRDDKFLNFFKRIMEQLTQTFANIDLKKAKSTEICGTLINFIFKILANKDRENLLEGAVTILNKIIEEKIEVAEYVLDYLTSNQHNLKKHLLCESFIIPNQIVQIVDKTLKQIHSVHKFSLLEEPKTLLHYNYIELIKLTFGMFPRIPERLAKYSKPLMIVSF